jgi:hypothetical protein
MTTTTATTATDSNDGWQWFSLRADLERLTKNAPQWRISEANKLFALCASYPELLAGNICLFRFV